ncbi:signal peptide peptidase SppA [Candidatus Woesearchaeota archaeon]|nr:signal peptide peptidase SppA [Candidatus Woesearchaeota archaeon]
MKTLGRLVMIVVALFLLAYVMSWLLPYEGLATGNIAKIFIEGEIVVQEEEGMFGRAVASSTELVKQIEDASLNPSIEAVIFEINSPGGSAVASYEVANAIKKVNKTKVAVIREIGTSGAYWAASATDWIIANEFSVTGSIGVLSSYLEFSKLFDKYGVTYQRLVGGEYKDMGSPFKEMSDEERRILQAKVDKIHEILITRVAENRGMELEKVKSLATGEFYIGSEALENGLIDAIGDEETAKEYIKEKLNITTIEIAEYRKKPGFLDIFGKMINENFYFMGKGQTSFMEIKEEGIKT